MAVPDSRWLRPSAVEGALALRQHCLANPNVGLADASRRLTATYATAGLDFSVGAQMLEAISGSASAAEAYRSAISHVARLTKPAWLAPLVRGRGPLFAALGPDMLECFRRADALNEVPPPDVVRWLDELNAVARGNADLSFVERGREAEALSMARERDLLSHHPNAPSVEWLALDDNALGYDIRSYRWDGSRFVPLLIEVKGCGSEELVVYVTRNEYEVARRARKFHVFHVWHLPSRVLHEVPVETLEHSFPQDRGSGRWREAQISVRKSLACLALPTDL